MITASSRNASAPLGRGRRSATLHGDSRSAPLPGAHPDYRGRWVGTLPLIVVAVLLTLIAQRETALGMVEVWSRSRTYAYAWLVLPAVFFLLWNNRARLARVRPTCSVSAILPAMLVAALAVVGDLANIGVVRELALVAAIATIVLAAVGWHAFWQLSPYVALLFFCIPAGEILLEPLKTAAVGSVRIYTAAIGLPFEQDGFAMLVGPNRYVVIDDCAGVEHAIAGCFIGLVLALLLYDHPTKVAALGLLGGLAGVASNVIRILSIVSYDYFRGTQMSLSEHRAFETPALALSFAALLIVFSRLRRPESRVAAVAGRTAVRRWSKLTAVAGATAPMLLVSALNPPMLPATAALSLPEHVVGWTRQELPLDWKPRTSSSGVDSFVATYGRDDGNRLAAVFAAEAKSARDKVSGGALDLVGSGGWLPAVEERIETCVDARCVKVTHLELLQGKQRVRHLYVAYIVGSEVVATPLAFRLGRAWSALRGRQDAARVVAVAVDAREGLPADDVAAFVLAFAPNEQFQL